MEVIAEDGMRKCERSAPSESPGKLIFRHLGHHQGVWGRDGSDRGQL